jgi:hypothetical protein
MDCPLKHRLTLGVASTTAGPARSESFVLRRRFVAARVTVLFAIMPCGSRCIVPANIAIELMTGKPLISQRAGK